MFRSLDTFLRFSGPPSRVRLASEHRSGYRRAHAEHNSADALAQRLYDIHLTCDGFRHYSEPLPD